MVQRKIKVLVITYSFPTKYNPIAAIFILNQMLELKKYCDIKVLFPHAYVPKIKFFNPYRRFSEIKEKETVRGIEVYHPKYFMFPRIAFVPKLLNIFLVIEAFFSYQFSKKIAEKIAKEWNPDIIHLHSPIGTGLIGTSLKKKFKKPMILTVHGKDVTKFSKESFSKTLAKSTFKNSDAIICQSKFLKNELKKIGIKDSKFHIIPMGAKKGLFKLRNKQRVRKMLDLPMSKEIILFAGHLEKRKGPEYLIKAMKKVVQKEKEVICYIIGKGELDKELKKMTSELNLEKHIKFLGLKTNDEVALYMSACNIFVLPSLMEGMPVVLCEALLSGKPVVATSVAGTPELVTKDVGYLVKPKDEEDLAEKIIMAFNRKWDTKKLLKRGNEFSVPESVKKLVKVYQSFIDKT